MSRFSRTVRSLVSAILPAKRTRTPLRLQCQTTECGVAALAAVLAYYGLDMPLEKVRAATGVSRDCLNAGHLARAARSLGLTCSVRRCEPERLAALGTPSIVYLSFIHFAIFEGVREGDVLLNDPSKGRCVMAREEFDEAFTGIVLTFAPNETFQRGRERPLGPWFRREVLQAGGLSLMAISLLATLAGAGALVWLALALAQPSPPIAEMVLAALLALILLTGRGEALGTLRYRLAGRLGPRLLRHTMTRPGAFFAYRIPFSLSTTIASADKAADLLCLGLLPRALDLAAMLVVLGGLAWLHPPSALAAALLLLLYGLALAALFPWQREQSSPLQEGMENSFPQLFGDLDEVESWKVGNREHELFVRTLGLRAAAQKSRQNYAPSGIALTVAGRLLLLALPGAAAILMMRDVAAQHSVPESMLPVLLLSLTLAFLALRILDIRDHRLRLTALLFHIEDLLMAAESTPPSLRQGEAVIRCRDLTYGHIPQAPPLIDGVSLSVAHGEQLGLTGPSGGGKSTLAMLLAGLREPWSGTLERGAEGVSLAWLDKQPIFFKGSIRENLRLWQDGLDDAALWEALREACLDEEIAGRDGGLDGLVAAHGRNFSGGQLQRLEIARSLVHGRSLLILDEALDALNPVLEHRLRANLRRRGCTLIIVSHRESTLAACDRVVTLVCGRITEPESPPPEPVATKGFADVLTPAPVPSPHSVAPAGLAQAFAEVTGQPVEAFGQDVASLADALGTPARRVRFVVPRWRSWDHPPLLGLSRHPERAFVVPPGVPPVEPAETLWRLYRRADGASFNIAGLLRQGVRDGRRDFWRVLALSVPLALLALAVPLVLTQLPEATNLTALATSLTLLVIAAGLLEASRATALSRLGETAQSAILSSWVQRLIRIRVPELRRLPREAVSDAVFALPRMVNALRGGWTQRLLEGGVILSGLGVLAWLIPEALAVAAALVGCALAIPLLLAWQGQNLSRRVVEDQREQRDFLTTLLRGQSRLRSLGREGRAVASWSARQKTLLQRERHLQRIPSALEALETGGPWLALGVLLGILATPLTAASGTALFLTLAAAARLGRTGAELIPLGLHRERMNRLARLPLEPRDAVLPPPQPASTLVLEAVNIHFAYGRKAVLQEVSIRVAPGEVVALAGASGSGKSTLLRLLLGHEAPERGEIRIGGQPLNNVDPRVWRRHLGLVQQTDWLEVSVTLRAQLCGLASVDHETIWRVLEDVRLADEVRAMPMGLQTITDDIRLSTGQMQRLLIGRQLIRNPSLLVLDEATNAVPDSLQEQLIETFRKRGIGLLLVTHRASALALADRLVLLEQGRVAFSGDPMEALRHPAFAACLASERVVAH